MALRLRLKAGERVIVGGAILRNGSKGTELVVENETPVLRENDVLRLDAVRTRSVLAHPHAQCSPVGERMTVSMKPFRAGAVVDPASALPNAVARRIVKVSISRKTPG